MSTQSLPIACTTFKSFNLSNSLPSTMGTYFRFRSDFESPQTLGHGAYAQVFKARNRLDGQLYAIKRIKLSRENCSMNNKILREVFTLSSLTHPNIVRYYQSWIEDSDTFIGEDSDSEDYSNSDHEEEEEQEEEEGYEDLSFDSSEWDPQNPLQKPYIKSKNTQQTKCIDCKYHQNSLSQISSLPQCLYIQMEYCPVTLKDVLLDHSLWKKSQHDIWNLFRQILEGLEYLHSLDIVHRDLKPDNIFFGRCKSKEFDVLKIGDFGLATSLKETSSKSCVGTYLYTSPEYNDVEHHPSNEKVDIFACGIILFELWCPFTTAMERIETLDDLRNHMKFPASFGDGVCEEKDLVISLVQKMLHKDPTERPSAQEIIQQLPTHEKEIDVTAELRRKLEKANKKIELLMRKNAAQRAQIGLLSSKNKKIKVIRGSKSR